jgi:carbamate kinase
VEGVFAGWGTPDARRIEELTPAEIRAGDYPAGSMGPKVDAAASFVEATGRRAAIGALADIAGIVAGTAGTSIAPARAEATTGS